MIYDFPAVKDTLMQRACALESEPCCMERGVKGVSFCNSNSDIEYYLYPSTGDNDHHDVDPAHAVSQILVASLPIILTSFSAISFQSSHCMIRRFFSTMSSSQVSLTPLKELSISSFQIPAFDRFPNSFILKKPLLVYHSAFVSNTPAASIESHLQTIGAVEPQWRYTMYQTSHFHSTTHEVLCVSSGKAKLCFGGEDNPKRAELDAKAGDVMVVPAGVAHRLLEDHNGDFEMVGSYPSGKHWDMCYGREGEEEKVAGIEGMDWFERDPIYGDKGPALDV